MIKLNKQQTKAFAIRAYWSWYIYLIPTIMIEWHNEEKDSLGSISIRDEYSGSGNVFTINIFFFVWHIIIDFWWNLKEDNYENIQRS